MIGGTVRYRKKHFTIDGLTVKVAYLRFDAYMNCDMLDKWETSWEPCIRLYSLL